MGVIYLPFVFCSKITPKFEEGGGKKEVTPEVIPPVGSTRTQGPEYSEPQNRITFRYLLYYVTRRGMVPTSIHAFHSSQAKFLGKGEEQVKLWYRVEIWGMGYCYWR